jgi:tetratricopeptide (TPR) repeat protein
MLTRCTMYLLCLLIFFSSHAQYYAKEKALITKATLAKSDSTRILALGELADFYYIYRASNKGDSIINLELTEAELSSNKNLLLIALFGKSVTNITEWTTSENFDRGLAFLEKGLNYAREIGREDYQAIAYMRRASLFRKRGQYDNAMNEAMLALSSASDVGSDSLKAAILLETGDIYLNKGKPVDAYKLYNQAYDLAYSMKNVPLESEAYHHYAALYQSLSESRLAKENLLKSLQLNTEHNNRAGIIQDYVDLARLTDIKEYFDKVIQLSEKMNDEKNKLRSKRLMFSYLMVYDKNCNATLDYYNKNPELQQSYINSGIATYYFNLGNIFKYCGQNEKALYYFKLAEPEMEKSFDGTIHKSVYSSMAECYKETGESGKAVSYFEKALDLARKQNDLSSITNLTRNLSELYAAMGNYKDAYTYQTQHLAAKDSLQKMVENREVVLMEVDRENNKHQKDIDDAIVKASRIRNLQYMGISAAIATLFIFLMLLGMFPISKVTMKMLSFFAFICLFEFIVLLIDSFLHNITRGEPLKIWVIKIFLIALLVPVQHFLEHGMVHFLASQRLLRMRERLSFKRFITNIKKPAPTEEEVGLEEDTAVL